MKLKSLFYLILLALLTSFIPAVHAQTFSVLHAFTGGTEGAVPYAGVTIRGNALYGTATGPICGTVYQLTHNGPDWLFSPLAALPHDCNPYARVVFGPDGHLYGTSYGGGTYGAGTVFKLTPPVGICKTVACYWTVSNIHNFSSPDGRGPGFGDLIWDQQGNIYGTTVFGGTTDNGTVYELTPSGNGYTESVLYSFSGGADGRLPWGGLVLDNNGNLFGTTCDEVSNTFGTVFELTYVIGVGWTKHVLYNFQGASDGDCPVGELIFDSSANLYGTTAEGGSGGGGTVFELSPSGNTWIYKLLYSFTGQGIVCGSWAPLAIDGGSNLYGTTYCDGVNNLGSVFKLSNTQNGWVYTSLHDFTGGSDCGSPSSNVTIDTDGALYGTTSAGGDMNYCGGSGCGVVWMIKP